jgi:hypothetical protein
MRQQRDNSLPSPRSEPGPGSDGFYQTAKNNSKNILKKTPPSPRSRGRQRGHAVGGEPREEGQEKEEEKEKR